MNDGTEDVTWLTNGRGVLRLLAEGDIATLRELKDDVLHGLLVAQGYHELSRALSQTQRATASSATFEAFKAMGMGIAEISHGATVARDYSPREIAGAVFGIIESGDLDELRNVRFAIMWCLAHAHVVCVLKPTLTTIQLAILHGDLSESQRQDAYRDAAARDRETSSEVGEGGLMQRVRRFLRVKT